MTWRNEDRTPHTTTDVEFAFELLEGGDHEIIQGLAGGGVGASQLHRRDNIQHIGGLSHGLVVQQAEMGEAGPADQDGQFLVFILLQCVQNRGTVYGQFNSVVDQYQPPEFITHFLQGFDEADHQFFPQVIIPESHTVCCTYNNNLFVV